MNQFCLGTRVTSTVTYKGRVHPIEGRITGLEVTFDREIDDHAHSSFLSDDGRDLQMRNVVFHRVEGAEEQTHVTLGPLYMEYSPGGGGVVDGGRRRRRTKKSRRSHQ